MLDHVALRRFSGLLLLLLLLPPLLLSAGPLAGQVIEEEILDEEPIEEEELDDAELVRPALADAQGDGELLVLLESARVFAADADDGLLADDSLRAARETALQAYDRLLGRLEDLRREGELSPTAHDTLTDALAERAAVLFTLGETEAAEAELDRLLELAPAFVLDSEKTPEELLERFEKLRDERIGRLAVTAEPPDLELRIDGRQIEIERPAPPEDGEAPDDETTTDRPEPVPAGPLETEIALPAGIRLLEARRAGYAPYIAEIEVVAGDTRPYEIELERVSAVLRLHTRPSGAEVFLDRIPYGATTGTAEKDLVAEGSSYRSEEFSSELVVGDVKPGLVTLEIRRDGFRPYRSELQISELLDYEMPPIVLEPVQSTIVLRDLPTDSVVRIDGELQEPEDPGASRPRFRVAPGRHTVQVAQGRTRMFATELELADRQTVEVNVRLRPGLAFLGVLGGREGSTEDLERALRLGLGASDRWSLLDRSDAAPRVLAEAGFTLETARRAATADAGVGTLGKELWRRIQAAVDAEAPGLIYLVAVLSDDLLASQADVFLWSSAPGPAIPDLLRVRLGQSAEIEELAQRFNRSPRLWRSWLGAVVATTNAAPHPFVADLTPGGPLASTGVRHGDLIVSVAGVPVTTGAQVDARLRAAESGETIEIGVQTTGGTQPVRVTLGRSPVFHAETTPGTPDALAFTELRLLEARAAPEDLWVLRLEEALILLRNLDHEGAVRLLRDVEAPKNPTGVGRATVDYWLGVALAGSGPRYRDAAIAALQRAAAVSGARLGHHDGPYLAPRARARLAALGATP